MIRNTVSLLFIYVFYVKMKTFVDHFHCNFTELHVTSFCLCYCLHSNYSFILLKFLFLESFLCVLVWNRYVENIELYQFLHSMFIIPSTFIIWTSTYITRPSNAAQIPHNSAGVNIFELFVDIHLGIFFPFPRYLLNKLRRVFEF